MFIPRHPVVENQFCVYGDQTATDTAGVGGVVAYAGAVVYLYGSAATNEEPVVYKMADNVTELAFGFLMQKVKTGYHQVHPTGFSMPGDLGSSDVIAQPDYDSNGAIQGTKEAPVGVAHLGIWDTVHYTDAGSGGSASLPTVPSAKMSPGDKLWPAADEAKVTTSTTDSDGTDYDGEQVDGYDDLTHAIPVAIVVKGASIAKMTANIANTTLYPIRIKLMI